MPSVFRRELLPNGKSRCFINDTPAKASDLRLFAGQFIDINSQSDSGLLTDIKQQLDLIDSFEALESERAAYEVAYSQWREVVSELKSLKESKDAADLDYLEFLYHELDRANVKRGEQEELEGIISRTKDAKLYADKLKSIDEGLGGSHGVMDQLYSLESHLLSLVKIDSSTEELSLLLQESIDPLRKIELEVRKRLQNSDLEVDIDEIKVRLTKINDLVRKHRVLESNQLVDKFEELAATITEIKQRTAKIVQLEELVTQRYDKVLATGALLQQLREKAAKRIEKALIEQLTEVDLPKARINLTWESHEPLNHGTHKPVFYFAANPGSTLEVLSKVASGGEQSRVKLALKSVLGMHAQLGCQIFDEIDTGISGSTAEKIGRRMAELAKSQQIIAITHHPQVAARGKHHWKVSKNQEDNNTNSKVEVLDSDARISEVARLLSGTKITDAAKIQAEALLYGA
jgi:DNA repair protein RecN (Recombination protein N)